MGLSLTRRQLDQFETYYRELVARNRDVNLTRITDYEDVQVRHFLDSLTCLPLLRAAGPLEGKRVIDLGSGAGFPGLPVKISAPELPVILLEATGKKADFLRHMVKLLDLKNVEVIAGRAEEVGHTPAFRERFDFVLARAVAALPALAELMLPLCRVGGACIAFKKGAVEAEAADARRAIELLGGKPAALHRVDLLPGETDRCLVVIEKGSVTPDNYPRRPGIPEKRPLR